MYQLKSRIRYSEIGEDGCLSLTGVINYLQDCSTFHSEDCGVGIHYLDQKHEAWMLSSWRILLHRYPEFGEEITVSTWPYGSKGIYAFRNYQMEDARGNCLAKADSVWVLVCLEDGLPQRINEGDLAPYGETGAPLSLNDGQGKIILPAEYEIGSPVTINAHHIDTNHHVNNAQYVEIAREAAAMKGSIRRLRAEYKKAAVLGDILVPRISRDERGVTVALCNDTGRPGAVVRMEKAREEKDD